jgi:hypothetical protein
MDKRKGLEDESLLKLAEILSGNNDPPYLVTNNVPYYDIFEPYGWTHPQWHRVMHSALRKSWGEQKTGAEPDVMISSSDPEFKKIQDLQLWADWFSILMAKRVYHTHSDFSLSAIHWMGQESDADEGVVWSRTIQGIDHETGELGLLSESWM